MINCPVDFKELDADKIVEKSGNVRIPIVSIVNLIKMKEISGRKQDLSDINELQKIYDK